MKRQLDKKAKGGFVKLPLFLLQQKQFLLGDLQELSKQDDEVLFRAGKELTEVGAVTLTSNIQTRSLKDFIHLLELRRVQTMSARTTVRVLQECTCSVS